MDGAPDLLIGAQWRHAADGGVRELINPATGKVFATVDEATHDDALAAVAAARAAFDAGDWPATPVAERAALLDRIADPRTERVVLEHDRLEHLAEDPAPPGVVGALDLTGGKLDLEISDTALDAPLPPVELAAWQACVLAARDRLLLSKGHAPAAYYAVLAAKGFIPVAWLDDVAGTGSRLGGHPDRTLVPGVEIGSGSLGHGLPLGVGMALGLRAQGLLALDDDHHRAVGVELAEVGAHPLHGLHRRCVLGSHRGRMHLPDHFQLRRNHIDQDGDAYPQQHDRQRQDAQAMSQPWPRDGLRRGVRHADLTRQ